MSARKSALQKFDLGRVVEDKEHAKDLNQYLDTLAWREAIKMQGRREEQGRDDLTQKEIEAIYRKKAVALARRERSRGKKATGEQVEKQSEQTTESLRSATKRAQKGTQSVDDIRGAARKGGMVGLLETLGHRVV